MMDNHEPRDTTRDEEVLQDLFGRTAAPLSDLAARRMEAAARGIPGDAAAHRGPLLGWLAASATLAAALIIAVTFWSGGESGTPSTGGPVVAMSQDITRDTAPDTLTMIPALSDEQNEGWASSLDPFGDDEAPSLVGSLTLAYGFDDPAEMDLWVQAADEILSEVDGI